MKILYTVCFLCLTGCILTHSQLSLYYALTGLQLWFQKMIPALLPFMILSGIMVRMRLTEGFASMLYPVIRPVYHVRKNVCYAMIMGFLCGFPMGARVTAELLSEKLITKREADFLLSFCNNIGPVYFCSFVLPLLHRKFLWPYLFGMYGLPLLYGMLLRRTRFRDLNEAAASETALPEKHIKNPAKNPAPLKKETLLEKIDEAVNSSMQGILSLGGYMIFFNLLNLPLHILLGHPPLAAAPLFEITGGLQLLSDKLPLYSLLLLPFGGCSCIAQTYSSIRGNGLSITRYTLHKLILTALTAGYYFLWFLFPGKTFLF